MRLIDADELLGIEKLLSMGARSTEAKVLMEQVIFDIQQSPTINPEDLRPKGKWVHGGKRFKGGVDWWHCSECKHPAVGADIQNNYCPNCGAKMEEEE